MGLDTLSRELFGTAILEDFRPNCRGQSKVTRKLKRLFLDLDYSAESICQRLGVRSLQSVPNHRDRIYSEFVLAKTPLDELIRLFLLNEQFTNERLSATVPAELIEFLLKIGILGKNPQGLICSTASIFPFDGLHVLTDAWTYNKVWGAQSKRHEDRVMYPGHDSAALSRVVATSPVEKTLDLCCGSGIQSLLAARWSEEVYAVDLNPRAIRMARFNGQLNGVKHATFFEGDLYGPVAGRKFDSVLANPPFVPAPSDQSQSILFRDGGETGESVLARILAGWADHATSEGQLAIVSDFFRLNDLCSKFARWEGRRLETHLFIEDESSSLEYALAHKAHITEQNARQKAVLEYVAQLNRVGIEEAHFGYLLRKGIQTGDVHLYRLTSPVTHAIHSEMEQAIRSRIALNDGPLPEMLFKLAPGISVTLGMLGQEKSICVDASKSLVGKSCEVSADTFRLLERVSQEETRVGDLTGDKMDHALRLVELGLLQLDSLH